MIKIINESIKESKRLHESKTIGNWRYPQDSAEFDVIKTGKGADGDTYRYGLLVDDGKWHIIDEPSYLYDISEVPFDTEEEVLNSLMHDVTVKESLHEATGEDEYSVKQLSFDVAINGDSIDGLTAGGNGAFFRALTDFLESQGMRMAGDMIDCNDMTGIYQDIYEDEGGIASLFM